MLLAAGSRSLRGERARVALAKRRLTSSDAGREALACIERARELGAEAGISEFLAEFADIVTSDRMYLRSPVPRPHTPAADEHMMDEFIDWYQKHEREMSTWRP